MRTHVIFEQIRARGRYEKKKGQQTVRKHYTVLFSRAGLFFYHFILHIFKFTGALKGVVIQNKNAFYVCD